MKHRSAAAQKRLVFDLEEEGNLMGVKHTVDIFYYAPLRDNIINAWMKDISKNARINNHSQKHLTIINLFLSFFFLFFCFSWYKAAGKISCSDPSVSFAHTPDVIKPRSGVVEKMHSRILWQIQHDEKCQNLTSAFHFFFFFFWPIVLPVTVGYIQ